MAAVPKPQILTAEGQAQWHKDVTADIWRMVQDLNDYGIALLEMLNVCKAGEKMAQSIGDRIYFKHHAAMLRLAIGFGQVAGKEYAQMQAMLHEHVLLSPEGRVISMTKPTPPSQGSDDNGRDDDPADDAQRSPE